MRYIIDSRVLVLIYNETEKIGNVYNASTNKWIIIKATIPLLHNSKLNQPFLKIQIVSKYRNFNSVADNEISYIKF